MGMRSLLLFNSVSYLSYHRLLQSPNSILTPIKQYHNSFCQFYSILQVLHSRFLLIVEPVRRETSELRFLPPPRINMHFQALTVLTIFGTIVAAMPLSATPSQRSFQIRSLYVKGPSTSTPGQIVQSDDINGSVQLFTPGATTSVANCSQ